MRNAIDGLEDLIRAVGSGTITARLEVDQPYAQRQHEELEWSHPRGGQAKYLEGPLLRSYSQLMQLAANALVTESGSDIVGGMTKVAEHMSDMVEESAPRLDNLLRYSGHPSVEEDGIVHYDRPPKVARIEK